MCTSRTLHMPLPQKLTSSLVFAVCAPDQCVQLTLTVHLLFLCLLNLVAYCWTSMCQQLACVFVLFSRPRALFWHNAGSFCFMSPQKTPTFSLQSAGWRLLGRTLPLLSNKLTLDRSKSWVAGRKSHLVKQVTVFTGSSNSSFCKNTFDSLTNTIGSINWVKNKKWDILESTLVSCNAIIQVMLW